MCSCREWKRQALLCRNLPHQVIAECPFTNFPKDTLFCLSFHRCALP